MNDKEQEIIEAQMLLRKTIARAVMLPPKERAQYSSLSLAQVQERAFQKLLVVERTRCRHYESEHANESPTLWLAHN